jgi:hypothetical protein
LAKITWLAAALLLSFSLAGPGQAAPAPKPGIAAEPDTAANAEPKPRPEPQAIRRPAAPAPGKQAAAKKPPTRHSPRHSARRSTPHRALAQTRRESWQARMDYDKRHGREYRPHSGPVYESPPGVAGGYGCDEACRYREWFERYAAWYDRYGHSFNAPTRGSAGAPANIQARPAPDRVYRPDQSERDRLDPWHGYNGRDGLGNGY